MEGGGGEWGVGGASSNLMNGPLWRGGRERERESVWLGGWGRGRRREVVAHKQSGKLCGWIAGGKCMGRDKAG